MNKDLTFWEKFDWWIINNRLTHELTDLEDVINIPDFGKAYIFDSEEFDGLFSGEEEITLNLPVPKEELVDDEVFYAIIKWGNNFYYVDLRKDEIELNIFKYVGKHRSYGDEIDYVNLGIHTPFELLNGSFMLDKWVKKAKFFNHGAIGVCDVNTLGGTLPLQKACKKAEINHVFGYSLEVRLPSYVRPSFNAFLDEFYPDSKELPADIDTHYDQFIVESDIIGQTHDEISFGGKVYCQTDEGWGHMLRIQKAVMVDNHEDPHIHIDELIERSSGNVFVFDKWSSKKITPEIINVLKGQFSQVYYQIDLNEYKADRFDRKLLETTKHYLENWHDILPAVLICDNYYLDHDDAKNKIILNKVASGAAHEQSDQQFYKHIDDLIVNLSQLFPGRDLEYSFADGATYRDLNFEGFIEEITSNTFKIADSAKAAIETGKLYAPQYEQTEEEFEKYKGDNRALFLDIIYAGFDELVPIGKEEEYEKRLDNEIYVIEATNNIDYYLITWDQNNKANSMGVQSGIGRGSAGGCLISYFMKIITIDPLKYDLIFERFLTPERCGLVPQPVCVVGDDIELQSGDDYVEIELEDGKTLKLTPDAELMVKRDDKKIPIYADELDEGDDILLDRRDELWEIENIKK